MSKRDWAKPLAVGLAVIATTLILAAYYVGSEIGKARGERDYHSANYERHSGDEIRDTCLTGKGGDITECIAEVLKGTNEQQRDESNLVAQTEMAKWAFWMLVATVIMAVITFAGVVFVWWTLQDARRIGEAQVRAYLSFDIGKITVRDPDVLLFDPETGKECNVCVEIEIQPYNTGQSPAHFVNIDYSIDAIPKGIRRKIAEIPLANSGVTASTLPTGLKGTATQLKRVFHVDMGALNSGDLVLSLFVRLNYRDVFDRKCSTPPQSGSFTLPDLRAGNARIYWDKVHEE